MGQTCIYVLKEVIDRHRSLNGLFMRFLDASKAFDFDSISEVD